VSPPGASRPPRDCDLLVVGGGPAGATLAALAAAQGRSVVVVERARFPRDKVCGEFLSAEGCRVLERLGALPSLLASGAVPIDACRVTHPRGPALDLPLPALRRNGRAGLGVSRALLDATLLGLAAERGAAVLQPWEATRPLVEGDRVRGLGLREVGGAGATCELRGRLVVGADGRRSMLGRWLTPGRGDPRRSRPGSWFGLARHFDPGGGPLDPRIELHLFEGGYAGLGPVENGRLRLGLVTTLAALRSCDASPDRLLARRLAGNPFLEQRLHGAIPAGRWRSIGPLRYGARRPTAAGVLFVGDAAGTVDPFCGEGMANALCGAELALPFALEALERDGEAGSRELALRYARAWRRAFGPVAWRVRLLGRLLERHGAARPVLWLLAGAARGLAPRLVASTRTDWSA
jgi:flavin-dependent dehydrogenase